MTSDETIRIIYITGEVGRMKYLIQGIFLNVRIGWNSTYLSRMEWVFDFMLALLLICLNIVKHEAKY